MAQDHGITRPRLSLCSDPQPAALGLNRPFDQRHYEVGLIQSPLSTLRFGERCHFPQYRPPSETTAAEDFATQSKAQEMGYSAPVTSAPPTEKIRQPCLPLPTNAPEFELGQNPVAFWRRQINRLQLLLTQFFVDWWLLEILSWCFSAVCMAAIFGLLLYYNGQEIPQWPTGITINEVISILSGLAKSALLLPTAEAIGQLKWNWFQKEPRTLMDFERIDMASRGAWGATQLLLRTKGMSLASIGAAVVVLTLPLDLFFQQVVAYPPLWVNSNTTATVPRATTYEAQDGLSHFNGTSRLFAPRSLEVFTEEVFLNTGTLPELNFTCSTSNCTWEPFDTLGICSKCVDISKKLKYDCLTSVAEWLPNVALADARCPNVTACGYYLIPDTPDSFPLLMNGYVVDEKGNPGEALSMRMFPFLDVYSRQPYFGGSLHFKDFQTPIIDFLIAATKGGHNGVYANETTTAHECVVFWCTKTIQSAYSWGRQQENISNILPMQTQNQSPWEMTQDSKGPITRYISNFTRTLPSRNQTDLRNNTFSITNVTALQAVFLLDDIVPSYVVAANAADTPQIKWLNGPEYAAPLLIPFPDVKNLWSPPNDVVARVDYLANVLTTLIRNTPDASDDMKLVHGIAWDQRTAVQVRWAWFSLPLALLSFSAVFLIATVYESTKNEKLVGIWKTSTIAVLFNGLDEEGQRNFGSNCKMAEARAKARAMKVTILPD